MYIRFRLFTLLVCLVANPVHAHDLSEVTDYDWETICSNIAVDEDWFSGMIDAGTLYADGYFPDTPNMNHIIDKHAELVSVVEYDNGIYYGSLVHNRRCGLGAYVFHSGGYKVGIWVNGSIVGGASMTSGGTYYARAAWVDGEMDTRVYKYHKRIQDEFPHGVLQIKSNGSYYYGKYREGYKTDQSIEGAEACYANDGPDAVYVGQFKEGEKHGEGQMYKHDLFYEGRWRNGRLVGAIGDRHRGGEWLVFYPKNGKIKYKRLEAFCDESYDFAGCIIDVARESRVERDFSAMGFNFIIDQVAKFTSQNLSCRSLVTDLVDKIDYWEGRFDHRFQRFTEFPKLSH